MVNAEQDPQFGFVPELVSTEWATDINILRLHDKKHGAALAPDLDTQLNDDGLADNPVVCQTCHYTPALDLANVGPLGRSKQFADPDANGRQQRIHATMSRVLHDNHGDFIDRQMPPPNDSKRTDSRGNPVINGFVQGVLEDTCYQCHPSKDTQCLRGAMFNGGLVCQDCHGNMKQVGNDFSGNLSADNPFPNGADLNKRIPWANEPACGACHTGDAVSNLTGDPNLIESPDGIRLLQAYRTNDPNAKPIVPTNPRFAENRIKSSGDDTVTVLYRLSKGHEGVFCEACHGSNHAEWPNGNPFANDNVTATQLQGHSGVIIECATCHKGDFEPEDLLNGPHGMHPVGNEGEYSATWSNKHEDFIEKSGGDNAQNLTAKCGTCHGTHGEGTVLAKVQIDRTFTIEECEKGTLCPGSEVKDFQVNLKKNDLVSCKLCHENPFNDSDEEEHEKD